MSNELAVASMLPPALVDPERVLRALKLDAKSPDVQALILVCQRYDLDPLLKHALLIQGSLYVTRDGLLHVAHRSQVFDGMEIEQLPENSTHYVARCTVWRKDMRQPFILQGRYPKNGRMATHGPEMAEKVAVCRALRHAFDVSVCSREETWEDDPEPQTTGAIATARSTPPRPLQEYAPAPEPVSPPEAGPTPAPLDPNLELLRAFAEQADLHKHTHLVNEGDKRSRKKILALMREVLGLSEDTALTPEMMGEATTNLAPWVAAQAPSVVRDDFADLEEDPFKE